MRNLYIDNIDKNLTLPIIIMPEIDMEKIEKEDITDEEDGLPPRFGYPHEVKYNFSNSGKWSTLPNGDKIWQLRIVCPNALSINFLFDKFWIPKGCKLFIYSIDGKHSIGAFTSVNNKGDSINVRGFATGLVFGNDVILEYYQPNNIASAPIMSIKSVIHGYRYIKGIGFGYAGDCQVNINCEEGSDWQQEKKAVALYLVNGVRWCTGSLINSTDLNQNPFFLTANHCMFAAKKDAILDANLDEFSFYWNYETPECDNTNTEPPYLSTSGGVLLANNPNSDFALLRLAEDPKNLLNFTPFYLGWDKSGLSGNAGVCIHHPKGDVKKISKVAYTPISSFKESTANISIAPYWHVYWQLTQNGYGTTERGSSGSALFNSNHKVIGQLYGGFSGCNPDSLHLADWYGKYSVSWTGDSTDIHRRLNCWLDSLGVNCDTMGGLVIISTSCTLTANEVLYNNIRIKNGGVLTIQNYSVMDSNNILIVEAGGQLVINGTTLANANVILENGSSLRIINGGTLKFLNDFIIPQGASIEVLEGEIIQY